MIGRTRCRVRRVDPSTLIFIVLVLFWAAVIFALVRFLKRR